MRNGKHSGPPAARRVVVLRGLAAAALLLPVPAVLAAQDGEGLTLSRVLRATLDGSPGIRAGRERLRGSAGEVMVQGGRFDLQLSTAVSGLQDSRVGVGSDGALTGDPVLTRSTAYQVGLSKQLRFGVLLQPEVEVTRTGSGGLVVPATGARVGLNLVVPLLKDMGGRLSAAPERAARELYAVDALALRHTASVSVLEAVSAFWGYLAAQERRDVHFSSVARAERFARETEVLVRSDERPASDLAQLRANVASKRMARISAEQAVVEARWRLGLAMGLPAAAILALEPAAGDFPAPRPFAPDGAVLERLVRSALAARPELAAAAGQERSAGILLDAARQDLRPQLDLALGVGYAGAETGTGLGGFVTPLYRNIPGVNTSVQLRYRFPVANAEARGRVMRQASAHAQLEIAGRDLATRIGSGVAVAAEALRNSARALEQAEEAVALYGTSVENENQKFRLGVSTLFDVTLAEDALTSALLAVVSTRQAHADALAALHFEVGTLLEPDADVLRVEAESLTVPPAVRP